MSSDDLVPDQAMSSYDFTKIFLTLDWKKEKAIFLKWRSFDQHQDHHHSVEVKVSCVRSCDFNSIGAALVDEKSAFLSVKQSVLKSAVLFWY